MYIIVSQRNISNLSQTPTGERHRGLESAARSSSDCHFQSTGAIHLGDSPEQYLTWDVKHFDGHWQAAQKRFEAEQYIEAMQKFGLRVPTESY
jgi:hypothetical protein